MEIVCVCKVPAKNQRESSADRCLARAGYTHDEDQHRVAWTLNARVEYPPARKAWRATASAAGELSAPTQRWPSVFSTHPLSPHNRRVPADRVERCSQNCFSVGLGRHNGVLVQATLLDSLLP